MRHPPRFLLPQKTNFYRTLLFSFALLIASPSLARAQFFGAVGPGFDPGYGYGYGYGFNYGAGFGYGFPGYGFGYGSGFPVAGFNPYLTPYGSIAPSFPFPTYGYPTALVTGNPMLFGASYTATASGLGPPISGFGLNYYNPYFSVGLTPLALQSAIGEMTLRSAARPVIVMPEVRVEIPVGPPMTVETEPEVENEDPEANQPET